MAQQAPLEYVRHGQTPFFRLPLADAAEAPQRPLAVLLGVPFDGGTTYQPGARLAPWHVRRVSAFLQSYHPVHRVDVFGSVPAVDGGNVVFPPFDAAAMRAAVEAEVKGQVERGRVPFLVGGDHSITLPALRAMASHHGPVAVIHVDAHLDTSGPEAWGEAFHHGTPIRHALAEGLVGPGQLFQIGIRGPLGSPDEVRLGEEHGGFLYPVDSVTERGMAPILVEIREAVGGSPVYLTLDVDGLDPAFAPGTGTPVPGGLTSREVLQLVRGLRGLRLAGMDVVEVCPALDHADATSNLAAHLLFEGLALLAVGQDPASP
jgi:agmatinase